MIPPVPASSTWLRPSNPKTLTLVTQTDDSPIRSRPFFDLPMRLFFYNLVLRCLTPVARWWLRRQPTYAPQLSRFSPPIPADKQGALWVQACSLGEVNAARPLVAAIRATFPERPFLVTTSTMTGHKRALELYGSDNVTWFPFDTSRAVRGFIGALQPCALVLFETELWPNVLATCQGQKIPVLLANGRLSDKHQARYARYRFWYGPLVRNIDVACMQSDGYAERLAALGVDRARIHVTGNIKFDAVTTSIAARERQRIRTVWGLREEDVVLLFASTRPGDEDLASACWATLREEFPRLKLVLAPRHLDRAQEGVTPFSEPVALRSEFGRNDAREEARVFVMDTLGELSAFYAVAHVVVVGGSFYPGVNGHNPLEAAALGIPTVFGPYMSNFGEAAQVLVAAGGSVQVPCAEDLYLALSTLLGDKARQRQMGTAARRAVLSNQGAVGRTVEHLEALLS